MVSRAIASCLLAATAWIRSHRMVQAMHIDDSPHASPVEASEKIRIGISAEGVLSDAQAAWDSNSSESPEESVELVEVVPLHQNLGVQFLPDNGDELVSIVRNLSAEGLEARYSVDEMERKEPTPWKSFWDREVCVEKREAQKKDDYFLVCHSHAEVIWTPKHKLAYMKIPKAASTAFWYFFKKHFADSEEISPKDLPEDAYVFTFARAPFEQKLAGFAEVDLKTQAGKETKLNSSTTFQHVPPSLDGGKARLTAFLDDIWHRRFHAADGRKPGHAGNQVGGPLCSHSVDFFGHLENLTTDWDHIQKEAKLPLEVRTKALPVVHADTSETHQRYRYDEGVPLSQALKEKMCMIYRSEFACLGYDAPSYCQKYGLP